MTKPEREEEDLEAPAPQLCLGEALRGGMGWKVELLTLQVLEMGIFKKRCLIFFLIIKIPAN